MADRSLSIFKAAPFEKPGVSHLSLWQESVASTPNAPALIAKHQSPIDFRWIGSQHTPESHIEWTFSDLDRAARRLATTLNQLSPIEKRPIVTLVNNQVEWALFYWAAAYLHSPFVPLNPKSAARKEEVSHMFNQVKPVAIVTANEALAAELEASLGNDVLNAVPIKIALSRQDEGSTREWYRLSDIMFGEPTPPDTPDPLEGCETTLILFTSGTTSLPKPCGITSTQCVMAALGSIGARNIRAGHRFLQHLPGFHSYGMNWTLGSWLVGAAIIFPADNFEPQSSLQSIELFEATHTSLVPTTAQAILAHPDLAATNLKSMVTIDVSGAGVLPSLLESIKAAFNVPAYSSYGMTESPGTIIWPDDGNIGIRDGEVYAGWPIRGATIKICDPDTRALVPRGQVGELHSGGEQVVAGYLDPKASTANFYVDDEGVRFIVTGDQAIMADDGAIRICGRYKDLIIRGGENISPASIEDYICKVPGIKAAQVVGIPDEMAGEVPVAVITEVDGGRIDLIELKRATAADLGPFFAPKLILRLKDDLGLDTYPCTASGKVRKIELATSVRKYVNERSNVRADGDASTIDALLMIWEDISGTGQLTASTPLDSFADSLMMMQLSGVVKRQLGKDVTVEDFKRCDTIGDQAALIEARFAKVAKTEALRTHPPTIEDVPHLKSDHMAFQKMQSKVEVVLRPLQLAWADVEDVMPLPDWNSVFAQRTRNQSWNVRFAFNCEYDATSLEAAVKASLAYHPTLRSVCVNDDKDILLVTLRANDTWFQAALTIGWTVDSREGLNDLLLDDPVLDAGVAPGPLLRIHIAQVKNDHTSGLVMVGSHAVHDMTMSKLWIEDVAALLQQSKQLPHHVSFKHYADAFAAHRFGQEATAGVRFWVNKLMCIGSVPEDKLWPPQRAPEWFKGNDMGWCRSNGIAARSTERTKPVDEKRLAARGIRTSVKVEDIAALKSVHNVPVFMLVKAAIALMNVVRTNGKEAVISVINAARTWPFRSDFSAQEQELMDGNPLDISGCLTEYTLDRIRVPRSKSVAAFMQQVAVEEDQNSIYAHSPFFRIIDELRDPVSVEDLRTWIEREQDANAILPLIRRQSFNWLPTAPTASGGKQGLMLQNLLTRMDNGLTIKGFLMDDKKSVALEMNWDAEHLSMAEAQRALNDLAWFVDRLGRQSWWTKTVGELVQSCGAL